MTVERWAQIKEIFGGALEQPGPERAGWLDSACGADSPLRAEVERLLAQDDGSLQSPAADVLSQVAPELADGDRISHYRVEAKLGQGGMGAVYRAYDTRLRRQVALKVLPPKPLDSQGSEAKLMREARAASALNHPNIVGIHEVGSDNGVDFIAMELVEGKTLGAVIPAKGLPLRTALDYAVQIAGGLAKAHSAGVVHRDLKPGNVMVSGDGLVKLLDFGLAKQVRLTGPEISTLTREGDIAGTPAYMSPEQAEGKPLDARSDIFSFGALLYEMLTGRRAFLGDSTASVLTAVLREEPAPLGEKIPRDLKKIVTRCVCKDPTRRFQHMDDARVELEEVKAELDSGKLDGAALPEAHPSRRWPWVAAIALAALAGVLVSGLFMGPALDTSRHRYSPVVTTMQRRAIAEGGGIGAQLPVWSPDAKSIVYSGDGLRLQRLDTFESVRLTTEGVAPFFSADGSKVYYLASGQSFRELWSVSVAAGAPERVLSNLGGFGPLLMGAAVSRDGSALAIIHSVKSGDDEMSVWISSPPGASPRPYPGSPSGRNLNRADLRFSPDNSKLLLTLAPYGRPVEWWLLKWPPPAAPQPNTARRLFENGLRGWFGTSGDWLSDNRHLIVSIHEEGEMGGPLWIADTVTGSWRRITPSPFMCTAPKISLDGRVLFHVPIREEHSVEIPLDNSPIRPLFLGLRREMYPSWSPVAGQILFAADQRGEPEIWLASRKEGWQRPVVTQRDFPPDPVLHQFIGPVFSPDGARIAYTSRGAIWVSPIAGGPPVRICDGYCPTWSPDGEWLAFVNNPRSITTTLMKVRIGASRDPVVIRSSTGRWLPRWSPDGRWITIQFAEGFGVVSPDGARTKILYKGTLDWGSACGWSRDGATLFIAYLTNQGRVLSAFDVNTGAERRVRDLGLLHFSYFSIYTAGLSPSPDGKSLAASTLNMRFEPWILDGLEPPRTLWARLFHRR